MDIFQAKFLQLLRQNIQVMRYFSTNVKDEYTKLSNEDG